MDERRSNETPEPAHRVVRRRPVTRIATIVAITILVLFLVGVGTVWVRRIPIATHYLKREFERRGVTASYHLERVGLRTQEVSNLVIGDANRPDLVARYARIETRLKWNGNFSVYRIVARGVRLRGRLVHGRISWGQIDKLLPPPSNKPFALPDFVLNVTNSSIALTTPFGPVGIALAGNGKLSGGFVGRVAVASPALTLGHCGGTDLHTFLGVSVEGRRPSVKGPVILDRFACPASRFEVAAPRFDANATFNEAFSRVDGNGRMAIGRLVAGSNGLANFLGDITYRGSLQAVDGEVKLSAQQSRLATITANRTTLQGHYHLGSKDGTFSLAGGYAANGAALAPSMLAGVTQPLQAAAKTPLGPVALAIGNAMLGTARNFNSSGHIKVVNFPGGGAARIVDADIVGPNGARAHVAGGSGVTYYWPKGGLRIDSDIAMGGGGLPQARVTLRQPQAGAPMSGVANLAPYSAGGQTLALAPIQFGPAPGGATAVSTIAQLDGRFPGGRVQSLRLPITGDIGPAGSFAFGRSCLVVSFNSLQFSTLRLGATRLPVCPVGPAIIEKRSNGPVLVAAQVNSPVLDGDLGKSPFHLQAASGLFNGQQFTFDRLGMRLGRPTSPVLLDAARLTGRMVGGNIAGNFAGAATSIGKVPLQLSDASGRWSYRNKDLAIDGAAMVSDRDPNPRFYPLRTNDLHFSLAGNDITATGSLHHPATGTLVTNVSIAHQLSSGAGHANLYVPGLTFGPNLQPEELTRLTEGVVALVNGTVRGQGRIDWAEGGKVSSSGDFSTANMSLAAPFGPVTGMSTTIHFDDLLGLSTPPGQLMTVQTVNPGILVTDGVIHYQLLPHNRVKVEQGEWPFMGGKLILEQTVLDFSHHSAKHLTFRLVGFDAKLFVDSLGFSGFELSGIFDGELPMVFDDSGGRIIGGRLVSRAPGGELKYTGTKPKGLGPGLAVDLLSDIRYRSMTIGLDGDLSGEFATKLTIDQVSLGPGHGFVAGLVHSAFSKLPLKLNVNINGPFRALIQMVKGFKDPTQVIAPVMPFPVDSPALKVDVLSTTKTEEQNRAPSTPPPTASPPPGGKK
jgi:hypothetical protein